MFLPAILLALLGVSGVQTARPGPARLELPELVARDARVRFTAQSAGRARALLDAGALDAADRSQGLYALGAGRSGADLPRIETAAAEGELGERKAALFALGELGREGWPGLERALERDLADLEYASAVALVVSDRRGVPQAEGRLEALALGDGVAAEAARAARALSEPDHDAAATGALGQALALYYELRWRAAQRFGLVDEKRWQTTLLEGLLADDQFLDRVILAAAQELEGHALRTHMVELLLGEERVGVLRAAAVLLPDDLARAYEAGEWKPSSPELWRAMLEEIDQAHAEKRAKKLVEVAFRDVPEVASLAGLLLLRAGGDLPWRWVADQLEDGTPEFRARLVEACGDRGDDRRLPDLADLLEKRPDLGLSGPGVVALARLGHAPARAALDEFVKGPASPERTGVLLALARVQHDRRMRRPALDALRRTDLEPEVSLALELGLAGAGEVASRERLRAALPAAFAAPTRDPRRVAVVRALGAKPEPSDLVLLRGLFPVEGDLDVNVELALVLIRQKDPAAFAVLRAALWSGSWNRSVLAGGVFLRAAGMEALVDEIESPPREADERDLRRVGFALGEWGGLGAVEALSRGRPEPDPALQGAVLGALSTRTASRGQ